MLKNQFDSTDTCTFGSTVFAAAVVMPYFDPALSADAGMVPGELRDKWFAEVAAAGERGEFIAVLTIWVAAGTT